MADLFGKDAGLSQSVKNIQKNLKTYEKKFEQAVGQLVVDTAEEVKKQAQNRFVESTKGDVSDEYGLRPHRRTGKLSRAIKSERKARMTGRYIEANAFVDNAVENYALAVEFGGNFTSSGKYFTIPLNDKAIRMRKRNKSLKSVKGLFFTEHEGDLFLAMNKGKDDIEFMFLLRKRIKVRKHPFMRPAMLETESRFQEQFKKLKAVLGK